MQRNCT